MHNSRVEPLRRQGVLERNMASKDRDEEDEGFELNSVEVGNGNEDEGSTIKSNARACWFIRTVELSYRFSPAN